MSEKIPYPAGHYFCICPAGQASQRAIGTCIANVGANGFQQGSRIICAKFRMTLQTKNMPVLGKAAYGTKGAGRNGFCPCRQFGDLILMKIDKGKFFHLSHPVRLVCGLHIAHANAPAIWPFHDLSAQCLCYSLMAKTNTAYRFFGRITGTDKGKKRL